MTDGSADAHGHAVTVESVEDPNPSVAERAAEQAARAGCDGLASVWRLYAHEKYYSAVDAQVAIEGVDGGEWRGHYVHATPDLDDRPTVVVDVGDAIPSASYGEIWVEPARTRAVVRHVGVYHSDADEAGESRYLGVVDEVAVEAGEVTRHV